MTDSRASRAPLIRRFFGGVGMLGRGFRVWGTNPGVMLLGALPALIVGVVYLAAFVFVATNADAIGAWATPFADGLDEPWRSTVRALATVAFLLLALLLVVYTFVAVTLAVGDPFYERIWRSVERRESGAVPESGRGFWAELARGVGEGLRLLLATTGVAIVLFLLGLIPVVGTATAAVLGAVVTGWFLALQLTGFAFSARGHTLRERRRMLAADRARSLGFGVVTYLLFLVPLGAVVVMPAAVAGATLLARDALGATSGVRGAGRADQSAVPNQVVTPGE